MINVVKNQSDSEYSQIYKIISYQVENFKLVLYDFKIPHTNKKVNINLIKLQNQRKPEESAWMIKRKIVFNIMNQVFMPTIDRSMVSILGKVTSVFKTHEDSVESVFDQLARIGIHALSVGYHAPGITIKYNDLLDSFTNFENSFRNGLLADIKKIENNGFYNELLNYKLTY